MRQIVKPKAELLRRRVVAAKVKALRRQQNRTVYRSE